MLSATGARTASTAHRPARSEAHSLWVIAPAAAWSKLPLTNGVKIRHRSEFEFVCLTHQ
jgi:hypothetical protein